MKKILLLTLVFILLQGCSNNTGNETNLGTGAGSNEIEINETTTNNATVAEEVEEPISTKTTVTYPSKDGLIITSDLYIIDDSSDFMILFHQAELSRGEYIDVALKFNELGYNVMAVDQRSGLIVNSVMNETAKRAKEEGFPAGWVEAGMDVQASIEYVRDELKSDSIYILGSSYSSSLILVIAPEYEEVIKGLLCFSPAERLKWNDKRVKEIVPEITAPVFMTSKKKEVLQVEDLYVHLTNENRMHYIPEERGRHGAIALWDNVEESVGYWEAVIEFLESTK